MSFPPQFLDALRARLTLSDVIGRRIKVMRAGREFKACCPFHKEKTPSFTINDDKQFYHCFGCGAHGDVIGFTMEHDNLSFPEAVEALAAQAGMEVPKQTPGQAAAAKKQKDLYELMGDIALWFNRYLHDQKNRQHLSYVQGRGLSPDSIQRFLIGLSPANGDTMLKDLLDKGYSKEQLIDCGVFRKSKKDGSLYLFFRNRVMFPVHNRQGKVVAFGGRILPDDLRVLENFADGSEPPKYINSSDTVLFKKSDILFGALQARQSKAEQIIAVEGYMDVIACHQGGFSGAVAAMGTSITEEQILQLWTLTPGEQKYPVLCFDGDDAGRRAAARACERALPMLKADHGIRLCFLPQGEDPDTMIKNHGRGAFQNALDRSMPMFEYLWTLALEGRNLSLPESRAGVTKKMNIYIAQIEDTGLQSHYKRLLSEKISETFFARKDYSRGRGNDNKRLQNNMGPAVTLTKPRAQTGFDIPQKILIAAVINNPAVYSFIEEEFGNFEIAHPGLSKVRDMLITIFQEHEHSEDKQESLDTQRIKSNLMSYGLEQQMDDILSESVYIHAVFCMPQKDKEGDETLEKVAKWKDIYSRLPLSGVANEIKMEWKSAFLSGDEESEAKIKETLSDLEKQSQNS